MSTGGRSDLEQRDAAARLAVRTRFDGAIVLEAGAGTGKTTALVARISAWLIDRGFEEALAESGTNTDPAAVATRALDGVLAITFTDAAAADMDAKIRAALAAIENGERPTGMGEHDFSCTDAARRERARALRRALDRPLARTIHAWCRTLLAEHALEASLHPSFEVDVDGEVVREIARRELTRDLSERLPRTADPDWLTLASRRISPKQVEDALTDFALEGQRGESLDAESFTNVDLSRVDRRMHEATSDFLEHCAAPLRVATKRTPQCGKLVDELLLLQAMLAVTASSARELTERARYAKQRISDGLRDKLREWSEGQVGAYIQKDIQDHAAVLVAKSRALWAELSVYQRLDPELEGAARRILLRLVPRVRAACVQRGVETFGDLLRDARDLLVHDKRLVSRLRGTFRQVLVDEFQDTDPLQCDIVAALALEDSGGTRPGLLIVGDPKQSIYGWRRADLRAYENFVNRALAAGGSKHALSLNFRSGTPILERVARAMRDLMIESPGVQPAFQPLIAHRSGAAAVLEHWNVPCLATNTRNKAGALEARAEARFLAAELRLSHDRGVPWSELGVLMRTMGALEIVLDELRDAGIPFDVVGDKSYYRRREVQDAAAFMSCIVDRSDHLALVAFLRAPFVGVPDAAWIPLWQADFPRAVSELDARRPESLARVREIVKRALAKLPRTVPFLERVEGFEHALVHALESLALLRQSFALEPGDVFLERARQLLALEATAAARWQGSYRVANLERFFHEIEAELERSGGDTLALLRYLRESIATAPDTAEAKPRGADIDAVQIQTIHKSKGLDYREVFVVGLHKGSRGSTDGRDTSAIDGPAHILFGAPNLAWFEIETRREAREAAESVRLLYVAMTRAKDRLVLSGTLNAKSSGPLRMDKPPSHLLSLLEPVLAPVRANLMVATAGEPVEIVHDEVTHRIVTDRSRNTAVQVQPAALDRAARARADSVRLSDARRATLAREARPLIVSMSAPRASHEAWSHKSAATTRAPGAAAIAGTAVHAALESVRLDQPLDSEIARVRTEVSRHVLDAVGSSSEVSAETRADAAQHAERILDGFLRGPLRARLAAIAPHVVARELALLAASDETDGFASTASGSIDLVYRDSATGALVIVDFKTDAVANATEAHRAAKRHEAQMRAYRTALMRALALAAPPRAELWFLAAGEIVALD